MFVTIVLAILVGTPASADPPAASADTAVTRITAAQASAAATCPLATLSPEAARAADCVSCHGSGHTTARSHPVGIDYASAQAGGKRDLAPLATVTAAGVAVPGGKVQCITCHDPQSPWADHVVLPAGATPKEAVVVGNPQTYEAEGAKDAPPPGSRVSAKPLCMVCHAY